MGPATNRNPKASWDLSEIRTDAERKFKHVPDKLATLKFFYITGGSHDWAKNKDRTPDPKIYRENHFVEDLLNALPLYGFAEITTPPPICYISPPDTVHDHVLRRKAFCKSLTDGLNAASRPSCLVILLASKDADDFSHIKWWADCIQGVANVCITPKGVEKVSGKGTSPDHTLLANIWYGGSGYMWCMRC
jgi:hypothetical protein